MGESLRTVSPALSSLVETSALPLFSIATILIKELPSDILLRFFRCNQSVPEEKRY